MAEQYGSEDVETSKRIRDSLAIMKERNGANQMLSGDPTWTDVMEQRLLTYASEQHHDFELVAAKMAEEYDKHIFDAEACYRRWALLDLSDSNANALLASPSEEESQFASTEKSLAYFSNAKGVRKTMNELCFCDEDSDLLSTLLPDVLPEVDDQSEESDTVMHSPWESLEV